MESLLKQNVEALCHCTLDLYVEALCHCTLDWYVETLCHCTLDWVYQELNNGNSSEDYLLDKDIEGLSFVSVLNDTQTISRASEDGRVKQI